MTKRTRRLLLLLATTEITASLLATAVYVLARQSEKVPVWVHIFLSLVGSLGLLLASGALGTLLLRSPSKDPG